MDLWERIRDEFQWQNFLFNYKYPGRFIQMECGFPRLYAVWRMVWMAYNIAAIISSGYLEQFYASSPENRIKWFIFMTNWAFIVLTITTILDFFSTVYSQWRHPEWLNVETEVEDLPLYLKALWALSSIANTMSIIVSISYWTSGVYDPARGLSGHRVLPFLGHGMNTIYVICNLCVTAMPVRLLHVWMPFAFTFLYGVFNFFYIYMGCTDDTDHHYIYPPIDWRRNPVKAELLATLVIVGVVVAHVAIFVIHLVRIGAARQCVCTRTKNIKEGQSGQTKTVQNGVVYGSTVDRKSS